MIPGDLDGLVRDLYALAEAGRASGMDPAAHVTLELRQVAELTRTWMELRQAVVRLEGQRARNHWDRIADVPRLEIYLGDTVTLEAERPTLMVVRARRRGVMEENAEGFRPEWERDPHGP